jgi:signal transduction histidine kinase
MDYRHVEHRSGLSRIVLIALISATIGLLLALLWIDFTWRAKVDAVQQRQLRVKELQGEIVHLDEVLTMSALMAATSGNERWEDRYREFEPKLTIAIEEAIRIAPADGGAAMAKTEEANEKLVAMEGEAFELVHSGRAQDAQALLLSPEYIAQKQIYAAGMTALDTALEEFIDASGGEMVRGGRVHLALNLGAVMFVVLGWSIFFRAMLMSENQMVEQHGKLHQLAGELAHANHALELRAEELAHTNADLAESNLHLSTEIETRIHAEAAQKELHAKLLVVTRQAGMAEIATGVLHNVGNALTSVNVAASLSMDLVKRSRVADLTRAISLISEHVDDLASFFTEHPRGQFMLKYLSELAIKLRSEQSTLLDYLEDLGAKVDHTKQIVKSQQTYAKVTDLEMEFDLKEVAKDVLKTLGGSMEENGIELVREWHDVPLVCGDKHKVMQILVNLVTNAIHALLSSNHHLKRLTVRLDCDDDHRVYVDVEDTGIGIDGAHLTKIFQYGFTTKQTGHGFGLHHSALVAREMGGELRVHSDGVGRGARFTLELPITRDAEIPEPELIGV